MHFILFLWIVLPVLSSSSSSPPAFVRHLLPYRFRGGAGDSHAATSNIDVLVSEGFGRGAASTALNSSGDSIEKAREILAYDKKQQQFTVDNYGEAIRKLCDDGFAHSDVVRILGSVDGDEAVARNVLQEEKEEEEEASETTGQKESSLPALSTPSLNLPKGFDPTKSAQPKASSVPKDAEREDVIFEGTAGNLQELLINSPVPVLLDVYAPWCGPCKALTPALEQMAIKAGGMFRLIKVNADDERVLTSEVLKVTGLPTVFAVSKEGAIVNRFVGMPKEEDLRTFMMDFMMGKSVAAEKEKDDFEQFTKGLRRIVGFGEWSFQKREALTIRVDALLGKLLEKGFEDAESRLKILRRLIQNLLSSPGDERFQKINLAKPKIAETIASSDSCVSILRLAGFKKVEGGDELNIPRERRVNVAPLSIITDCVDKFVKVQRTKFLNERRAGEDDKAKEGIQKMLDEEEKTKAEIRAKAEAEKQAELLKEAEKRKAEAEKMKQLEIDGQVRLKWRLSDKKKTHVSEFSEDDPIQALFVQVLNHTEGDEETTFTLTCAAKKIVLNSSSVESETTFADVGLVGSCSVVIAQDGGIERASSGEINEEGRAMARQRRKSKRRGNGPATLHSIGVYSKNDNKKNVYSDGANEFDFSESDGDSNVE